MAEVWTILKMLEWTTGYFQQHGITEGARREAELLLGDTLGLDRVGLYLNFEQPLQQQELNRYREKVKRRGEREPVQYILGTAEFWSLPFRVAPGVLIPRSDTEILVEEAMKRVETGNRVLDVGTGSGAIAISMAHEDPSLSLEALDLSGEALAIARENACSNGVDERIDFHHGLMADFGAEIGSEVGAGCSSRRFDMIVSNPPYIPKRDIETLMPEVRDHEPHMALDGGADGLDFYRQLVSLAKGLLKAGGWLLVEVGIGQSEEVSLLFAGAGFEECSVRNDYADIPRVVVGRLPVADAL